MSFILACTVMVLSVVYTDAFQSRTENFNKKYTLTGNQADDIASVAVAQLGRKGKTFDYTEDWCVNFVRDCARCAGIPDSVIPECSGVSDMYNTLLSCGAVRVSSPRRGDLVFYSNPSEGFTHMGLMIDSLQSVHGNVNGHGDDYTFMRTSEVDEFKYSSFRPGSPCFLRPKYSNAVSRKSSLKKADLGNDFYARIVNPETGKALTADKGNNVVSFSKKIQKLRPGISRKTRTVHTALLMLIAEGLLEFITAAKIRALMCLLMLRAVKMLRSGAFTVKTAVIFLPLTAQAAL